MIGRLVLLAVLLAPLAPARAQEPMTILAQKQWSASGVCVGLHQCGFCWASATVAPGLTLRVEPPKSVSVQPSDPVHPASSALALEIGGESFTLAPHEDDFAATEEDAIRIIHAMRHAARLTLRLEGNSYPANLDEFGAAYDAILESCPGTPAP
jgi:hypothetical protein